MPAGDPRGARQGGDPGPGYSEEALAELLQSAFHRPRGNSAPEGSPRRAVEFGSPVAPSSPSFGAKRRTQAAEEPQSPSRSLVVSEPRRASARNVWDAEASAAGAPVLHERARSPTSAARKTEERWAKGAENLTRRVAAEAERSAMMHQHQRTPVRGQGFPMSRWDVPRSYDVASLRWHGDARRRRGHSRTRHADCSRSRLHCPARVVAMFRRSTPLPFPSPIVILLTTSPFDLYALSDTRPPDSCPPPSRSPVRSTGPPDAFFADMSGSGPASWGFRQQSAITTPYMAGNAAPGSPMPGSGLGYQAPHPVPGGHAPRRVAQPR